MLSQGGTAISGPPTISSDWTPCNPLTLHCTLRGKAGLKRQLSYNARIQERHIGMSPKCCKANPAQPSSRAFLSMVFYSICQPAKKLLLPEAEILCLHAKIAQMYAAPMAVGVSGHSSRPTTKATNMPFQVAWITATLDGEN
eukprot:1160673-Pelagomonas_calceolata.AAC.3